MRLKELKQYLKENKLIKHLTPNPTINTGYFTHLVYERGTNCLAFIMKNEGEPLTTAKVQEFIDKCDTISDDTLITIDTPALEENNNNLVRWFCEDGTTIAINEKSSEDVAEELISRFNNHLLKNDSDADFVQSCFESGFTLKDFKLISNDAYFFAKRTKKEFGLSEIHG